MAACHLFLTKIRQQRLASAFQGFGQTQKSIKPPVIRHFALWRGKTFVNLTTPQADVIRTIKSKRLCRCAIPPRTPDFLIITLNGFGEICVCHPANVRFINTHPEGHSCDNDQPVFGGKTRLNAAPRLGLHPSMIMTSTVTRLTEGRRQTFGFGPCSTIDDAGLPFARGGKIQDLFARAVFGLKRHVNVGAVKTAKESFRWHAIKEAINDFVTGFRVRRRGKGGQGHVQLSPQFANTQIIWAKVMTPLAHTMGFIHRNQLHVVPQ